MADPGEGRKKRPRGCYVSCCFGWTLAVTVVIFVALLLILFLYVVIPQRSKDYRYRCREPAAVHSKMADTPVPLSELWQKCELMAKARNVCIGLCDVPRGIGWGPRTGPFRPLHGLNETASLLTDLRLNRTWLPSHYEIILQPWIYSENDTRLNGSVQIYMVPTVASKVIVLHAQNLNINEGTLQLRERNAEGIKVQIKDFVVDADRHFIKIYTYDTMEQYTEYYLKIEFDGTMINDDMLGFYRSVYIYQGFPRYLGVTQFEVAGARRAFPCFDEPSFKATFTITLVRKRGFTALCNTALDRTRDRGEWQWDRFKKSPIMSTYIVAMFVGQYASRQKTTPKGTLVRIWAQPEYIGYVDVAITVTGQMIEAFEDYTGIKYPLAKTDMVVVRDTIAAGMENWGLVVYAEGHLLLNPAYSASRDHRRVVDTIAHEIAHQWFGNLVTMRWWDDTFLNEAFATYMGKHIGVPSVRPTWNQPLYFISAIQQVMVKDTSPAAKPVRIADISPNSKISEEAFTDFSYQKGAAIMRMFRYFLKDKTFKKAVRTYLSEFSYRNAEKDDLINVFDKVAQEGGQVTWNRSRASLSEIATSWLDQTNFPLLEVTNLKAGKIRVKQSRFGDLPKMTPKYTPPFSNYSWYIPLTYANSAQLNKQGFSQHWIYRDDVVNFEDLLMPGWKLVNVFSQGYYRVKYDEDTWTSLLTQLRTDHTLIPVESRSGLIDDAFALATEGYTSDVTALPVTSFLVNETEYIVFRPFFEGRLREYNRLLRLTPAHALLNSYALELIIPSYDRLGWTRKPQENQMDKSLRQLVLKEACSRNYQPCILEAIKQFQQLKKTMEQGAEDQMMPTNPIDPDLRNIVYCTAIKHGGLEILNFLMGYFFQVRASNDFTGNELTYIVLGLTCAEEPGSLDRMLQWAISLDLPKLIEVIAAQPGIVASVWDYVDRNWEHISSGGNVEDILWILTDYFGIPSDLQKLRHFIADHTDINRRFGEELITKVKDNMNWVSVNEPAIREWLMSGRFGRQDPARRTSGHRGRRSVTDVTGEEVRFWYPKMGTSLGNVNHTFGDDLEEKATFVYRQGRLEVRVVGSGRRT